MVKKIRNFFQQGGLVLFVLGRILAGIPIIIALTILVFVATQALPGDAAVSYLANTATPERLAAIRDQLNLEDSIWQQYFSWATHALRFDFGTTLTGETSVSAILGPRIQNTLILMASSGIVAIPLSIIVGVYAAVRRGKFFDSVSSVITLILAALPEFVVAIFVVFFLATNIFMIFPAISFVEPGTLAWSDPMSLALPTLTLVLAVTPYVSRIMRGSMIEVMESEYIQMARLKGLSERTVILRHALPNAIAPTIQVIALQLAWLAGGVVVVEAVFAYPGIGTVMIESVKARDLPIVQAITLMIGALYVVLNILADIGTILSTPRLRTKYVRKNDTTNIFATMDTDQL
jgi:peptide/nickel transport system permease protein